MNLNAEFEGELFLSFAEGFEDGIIDDESETITLNDNQAFHVRSYTCFVEWNIYLAHNYGKPLTTDRKYEIPGHVVMCKRKEVEREHLR